MNIVILGLSITSSWGNGHATTYRGLVRELGARGHDVLFLERDVPWYRENRDAPEPEGCTTRLYRSVAQLRQRYTRHVREADLVIVGSYVPDGVVIGEWVTETVSGLTAFYDIDTPVTLAKLARRDFEYLSPHLIPRYDLYLSFTGGPTLRRIERQFRSPMARPLYCSFDPESYYPETRRIRWDLGYLGTYSDDRQPTLERLLIEPARRTPDARFIVAGPQYPDDISWPRNVKRVAHLPPREHRQFYNAQRFTLNVTRAEMIRAGWSPSVRLFEAAACAVPIISDWWDGLDTLFTPGREILIARSSEEVLRLLSEVDDEERAAIGERARERVLREHTAAHRAQELESYVAERYASASCAHSLPGRRMMSASKRSSPPPRERSSSTSLTRP
ncbi:MAG TPA: glycosyltransferase [Thermoanaerobaculia bacterium]|nr:glycosyltransferase [Thermoanaerobaculia bacterium]